MVKSSGPQQRPTAALALLSRDTSDTGVAANCTGACPILLHPLQVSLGMHSHTKCNCMSLQRPVPLRQFSAQEWCLFFRQETALQRLCGYNWYRPLLWTVPRFFGCGLQHHVAGHCGTSHRDMHAQHAYCCSTCRFGNMSAAVHSSCITLSC